MKIIVQSLKSKWNEEASSLGASHYVKNIKLVNLFLGEIK